jgi:hypothetical protein
MYDWYGVGDQVKVFNGFSFLPALPGNIFAVGA